MKTRWLKSFLSAGLLTAALSLAVLPSLAQDASDRAKMPVAARAKIFLVMDISGAFLSESCQSPQWPLPAPAEEENTSDLLPRQWASGRQGYLLVTGHRCD